MGAWDRLAVRAGKASSFAFVVTFIWLISLFLASASGPTIFEYVARAGCL